MAFVTLDTTQDPYERLALWEKEVLQPIAQGKSNKEIGAPLNKSVNATAVLRARIMDSLGLRPPGEAVLFAVKK
jgi:DNA-binding NarL/FixJ family response regulator